ncbi:hypothetical protein Q3G72_015393 [Acer saccharum]|nr:hypothetical protein Q3G72_015393 [Acer saccharum]
MEEWSRGNWTNGCVRKRPLPCKRINQTGEVAKEDEFLKLEKMKVPYFAERTTIAVENCSEHCLDNCSCIAYAYDAGIDCMTWTGSLIDSQKFSNGGADLYIRLARSELEKKDNKVVVIVPVVAGIITCAICTFFLWRWMAKRKALKDKSRALLLDRNDTSSVENLNEVELQDLPLFSFEKLATATNNFHLTNKLGQGGFGLVYKGELQDGKEIAVKRLSKASGQGIEEFKNEDTECDVYGWCGEFGSCNPEKKPICSCLRGFEPKTVQEWNRGNWTSGCVRKSPLQYCERINQTGEVKKEDGFLKLETMKLPYFVERSSVSVVNCREYCLNNCSCIAYAYDDGIGCMTWTGSLIDLQKFSIGGADLYIRLAHSELEKKDNKVVVIVPVVAGTFTCAICIFFICKWMAKHRVKLWIFPLQNNQHLQKDGMPEQSPLNRVRKDVLLTMSLLLLSLKVASKEVLESQTCWVNSNSSKDR